jgi:hypothetical protein
MMIDYIQLSAVPGKEILSAIAKDREYGIDQAFLPIKLKCLKRGLSS